MFDYVRFSAPCPGCDSALEYQTKSGPDAPNMEWLNPEQVHDFYALCDKCGHWVRYVVHKTAVRFERVESESKRQPPPPPAARG